jgi:DNA-binding transcriptional regulator GbsR (MarR family)
MQPVRRDLQDRMRASRRRAQSTINNQQQHIAKLQQDLSDLSVQAGDSNMEVIPADLEDLLRDSHALQLIRKSLHDFQERNGILQASLNNATKREKNLLDAQIASENSLASVRQEYFQAMDDRAELFDEMMKIRDQLDNERAAFERKTEHLENKLRENTVEVARAQEAGRNRVLQSRTHVGTVGYCPLTHVHCAEF